MKTTYSILIYYKTKIILLRSEGYTVAEIRRQTNHHDNNIRKWIRRFSSHGIDVIVSGKHNHTAPKITECLTSNKRLTLQQPVKHEDAHALQRLMVAVRLDFQVELENKRNRSRTKSPILLDEFKDITYTTPLYLD